MCKKLSATYLVRNFVFLTAMRQGMDVTRLYGEQWREFEEEPAQRPFWRQEERQGRLKRSRMDLFLFHYVTFRSGQELKIGHLYQAFRDWWESDLSRSTEGELHQLRRYSRIYRELLAPNLSHRFGRFSQRLRVLDTTTASPLVLWLAGELGTESAEFRGILDDLESYLVRRAVCGYNQKAYNRLFLDLLNKMSKSDSPPTRVALHSLLGASSADSAVWPSDDEFRQHLINDPIYRTFGPRRTQMLLEALDRVLIHPYAEDFEIKSPLTVEHVLPQGAKDADWPLEVDPEETESDAWLRRNADVHRLGNLTLLTQPLNSSEGNGPYSQKRPAIAKQSLLALNTYFQDVAEWGSSAIDLRGNKLGDSAMKVWPGP